MRAIRWQFAAALFLALAAIPGTANAQTTGSIRGTVTELATNRPLEGAQVFIPGTQFGTLTDNLGRFLLVNVPAGTHTVRATLIGHSTADVSVTVTAGATEQVNIQLESEAIALQEIVVTGVGEATIKAKVPFDVATVDVADQPVPALTVASAMQGKAPGVRVVSGTGQPGQPPSILLRGATSINSSGRDQGPLVLVDGVIVSGGQSALADIDPSSIESIEIVKGAAAASLYGSRAASGVIQVRTKRGQNLGDDDTRYTFRTEYGTASLPNAIELNQSHAFLLNADQTSFVDEEGNTVDFENAVVETGNNSLLFHDNPFPGQTYDQIDRFFDPGELVQSSLSAAGRLGNTNYYGSFSNLSQDGIVLFNEGYNRQNFRLNLDHGLRDDLQISASTFYSTSWQDLLDTGSGAGSFFNLTFVPPNIDLLEIDPATDEIKVNPNPRSLEDNPLYVIRYRDLNRERRRFMGSALVRYAPVNWFDMEANLSYDRNHQNQEQFYPRGYARGAVDPTSLVTGQYDQWLDAEEAINGSLTASFRRDFGNLSTSTRARYLYEAGTEEGFNSGGQDLIVSGVPSLDVVAGDRFIGSYQRDIRSEGYFLISTLDLADKYILDGLIRRDGSSLFGAEERWQTYYRVSGAWRMAMEPWFQIPAVNELKLRASHGTAGGRPRFSAQYETYSVNDGRLAASTLGNRALKPEFSRELEVGADAGLFNRATLGVTYADSRTEDQILLVPLPGYAGFQSQWRNAGTLESQTWEGSIEATLARTNDFNWSARLLADRTNTTITELNIPAYQGGSSSAYFVREGERLGTFYGHKFATSCAELPTNAQQYCGDFRTDSNGYFVYTGGQDLNAAIGPDGIAGTADDLWGTDCSAAVASTVRNSIGCEFGVPVYAQCTDAKTNQPTEFCAIGNTLPDLNFSLANTFEWKGLQLFGLLDSSMGFNIYNQTIQWAYREERAGAVDQAGKSEDQKRPAGYYLDLYDVNAVNSNFVEDGSFVKLRELALRYSFGSDMLGAMRLPGAERLTLALIGRNLFTWTDYTGYDPEVGNPNSSLGSATLDRFDGYQYPNFRTLTASVEIAF
jgi:TonB-linked SusC/RagA family outer membrane protein